MEKILEKKSMPLKNDSPNQSNPNIDPSGGLIQSPKISKARKPTQRAIKDVSMGKNIISTLIEANRKRQTINGRIMAKYNAERPYDQNQLTSEGLGWRSNFTTKPLPQMIEKVAPRFEEAVEGLKYLTNSTLDNKWENSTAKTEYFQKKVTETIRARKSWKILVSDIALDNALFGYTVVANLDEFSWMPVHFSQDESFLPDRTKQCADNAQVVVLREICLPHELFAYIKDKDAADSTGWLIGDTIDSINNASPSQLRDILGGSSATDAWYQNAERELTVGSSHMAGASVINVYHLLACEVTGKVSHYRFADTEITSKQESMKLIYEKEDRFPSMSDCAAFFTFQKGNKSLHGSKGIGRDIYELAGMQDRMRNEVVDRGILSGKTFVQGDFKMLHKFKMSVVGATVIVPNGWTFLEQKVDGNIESFLKLDAYFTMIVDQLIGSVSPRTFQGDRVTKAEVDLFAEREEAGKDSRISRFLQQFVDMVGTMQRRLCDKDTTDDEAKKLQKELLKMMTREEIDEIAAKPVAGTVRDLTPLQRQMVAAFVAEKRGNPLYNQRKLEVEDLNARMGSEFADKVLLPEEDPTESAEQQRMQLLELGLLSQGQAVPASPRDNHQIHLKVLMPAAEALAGHVLQGQAGTPAFAAVIHHLEEHYNFALQSGVDKEELKPVADIVKKSGPVLAQLAAIDEQAAALQAPPDGGAPPAEMSGQTPPG